MVKKLLVTLADKNYVNQAKQVFSSAYFKGKWKGEFMLLSHKIPEKDLKWFRNKGILIRKCKPLEKNKLAVRLDKFYLFTEEFKKWNNIVFIDADTIIRGDINKLGRVKGFWAVPDGWENTINDQSTDELEEYSKAFNSGVMAFSTDFIDEDDFKWLIDTRKTYRRRSKGLDQLTFNLLFQRRWKKLSWKYNVNPYEYLSRWGIPLHKVKGKIIHFVSSDKNLIEEEYKPWNKKSPFYIEWAENFENAENIGMGRKSRIISLFIPKDYDIIRNDVTKQGYKFNYKFTSSYFPMRDSRVEPFNSCVVPYIDKEITYLEIGVAEGASLLWAIDNILTHPESKAIVVDNFWNTQWKENFFKNLKISGFKKIKVYEGRSQEELRKIPLNSVDVIYVDGSHITEDVLQDLILSWGLLKNEGVMLIDDYYDFPAVKEATDCFTKIFKDKIAIGNIDNKILKVRKWQI